MEHRNGARTNVYLSVNLRQGNTDLGWHRVQNLGAGGLGLIGRVDRLADNSMVKVLIEEMQGNEFILYSMDAVVVHQQANSMGLMWASQGLDYRGLLSQESMAAA